MTYEPTTTTYMAVFPIGTPDTVIALEAPRRARERMGLEPNGDISVVDHEVKNGPLTIAYVYGTVKRSVPGTYVMHGLVPKEDDGRDVSTLDRSVLWPNRRSTPGALRSGSSGER